MGEKSSFALLNGISKRGYFGEENISPEYLHEQLYPDIAFDDFNVILSKYETLLKNIVYSNMDLKQLDAFLTSQARKKPDFLTDEEIANITKFWKQNKHKIHSVIVNKSCFNDKLKSVEWRVDVGYKVSNQASDPKVIFALLTDSEEPSKHTIHFEADADKLNEMVTQIENIEQKISDFIQ